MITAKICEWIGCTKAATSRVTNYCDEHRKKNFESLKDSIDKIKSQNL